jgi:hypothetical protein
VTTANKLSAFTEIQCTSGLQPTILICAGRPTSGCVDSVTINTDMVENVGKAVGISTICHSISEIYSTSGLVSAILNFDSRPTSDSVGSITIGSGIVENVGKGVGISTI